MRIAFVGAGQSTVTAARALLERGHEVVIVEEDEARLASLEEQDLDCGLMHGDGSRPAILEELDPANTDFLLCVSESDQDNILAALAGKALDFGHVVVKIEDPDFGGLCAQLGLEDVLVPSQEMANAVTDRVAGIASADLAPLLDTGLRFFSFAARERDEGEVGALALPEGARVFAVTRDGGAELADDETRIRRKDRVYAVCRQEDVDTLRERFVDE